eukprot:TRINITY_DN2475_c0_g1_i1.p1 TRINITY_DN2475_c0_g1~~TRINITY_DN2475_c0_g1_i1.p1  ORF type:complete len:243 (+),score=22.45 TRINITY_DN2475_c0_g1_i1:97-729(+)
MESSSSVARSEGGAETEDAPISRASMHPLQSTWTWWFDGPSKKTTQENWKDAIKQVATVSTVEEFWRLYNNLTPASQLTTGCNYHFFKQGVFPAWEDKANAKGGKWIISVMKRDRAQYLDEFWLNTLLACIGEMFDQEDEVCGCVVSLRKDEHKVSLWTRTSNDRDVVLTIGKQFKELAGVPSAVPIGFQAHADCSSKQRSFVNRNRHVL